MNVLILTPDAVGSTLLQRMLTIYMQFHAFGRPVINLHELTNGLAKYYSPEFGRELVSKKTVQNWGYHQSLQQVAELLDSVDHYKTSRLAHYHILQRGDTIEQQAPFYRYLNENFYIIACRRNNVFEHALSMTLNKITKKLNVYDPYEKIDTFYEIYKSGITLDPEVFVKQLDAYKRYINWSEQYFNIGSYFNYEQDIPKLEQYILNLPVFAKQSNLVTWDKNFGINFNLWNKIHYARSDMNNIDFNKSLENSISKNVDAVEEYQQHAPSHWPAVYSAQDIDNLPVVIKQQWTEQFIRQNGIVPFLSQEKQQQLAPYRQGYDLAQRTINQMVDLDIITSGPPIKKQTLQEKRKTIKNFDTLIELHNQWVLDNPGITSAIDKESMLEKSHAELNFWNLLADSTDQLPVLLPNQQ
jgi:hypothetical protein